MIVGRVIGFLLLVIAAIALVRDIVAWYDSGVLQFLSGTQLWFTLAADSWQAAQRWGADNLSVLWNPVLTTILAVPAFVSSGVLGLAIVLLSRKRRARPSGGGGGGRNLRRIYG